MAFFYNYFKLMALTEPESDKLEIRIRIYRPNFIFLSSVMFLKNVWLWVGYMLAVLTNKLYLFKIGARLGTGLPGHDRSKQNMEPPCLLETVLFAAFSD